jgi:hypothetical protein
MADLITLIKHQAAAVKAAREREKEREKLEREKA